MIDIKKQYMTLDEIMAGKQPGEVKVTRYPVDYHTNYVVPYYKDVHGTWHGLDYTDDSCCWRPDDQDGFRIWAPPKQKVVRYLWARIEDGELAAKMMSDVEAAENLITKHWKKLDFSRTEFEE